MARRAAWRGLAAASAATNILGKSLTARDRPHDKVPGARQLNRAPRTTSFPSGHAASAAAFATGVALEKPSLAAPVIIAAAAVGASRVVTGMHYPSDVLAGFTIGAAAGALTLRWWPRRPPVPAAAIRPPRGAPAVPSGEDLVLAVNRSAGTTSAKLVRRLRAERLLDRIDAPHLARVRAAPRERPGRRARRRSAVVSCGSTSTPRSASPTELEQNAAATWKKTFGFHPLLAFWTGRRSRAGRRWPACCGPATRAVTPPLTT